MKTLVELQESNHFLTDKHDHHSYLTVYDQLFLPMKDSPINFMELGIHKGGSLLLWKTYFSKARIFGLDKKESVYRDDIDVLRKNNIITMILDYDLATNATFNNIMFNIVIDDLSHDIIHQIKTFEIFRPKLCPGGYLIIEDIRPENLEYWKYMEELVPNSQLLDRRHLKSRYDDVLFIYKNI